MTRQAAMMFVDAYIWRLMAFVVQQWDELALPESESGVAIVPLWLVWLDCW